MEVKIFKENFVTENYNILEDENSNSWFFTKETKKINWVKDEMPIDINFNDEIESIEYIGKEECVDIEVSDDHLFIANNILTKNSKAISDTCDFLCALIAPEELREQNLQIWKILKNRFGGTVNYRFPIKTEHDKARLHDADDIQLVSNEMSDDAKNHKKRKKREPMDVVINDDPSEIDLFG